MPQNIYFVGMMGTGKTSVGRHLARSLKRDFFDSDQIIEARAGVSISWIFDLEGEEGFRNREQTVISELTALAGIVLSTGGGAVLRLENRRLLRSRGCVIHLHGPVEQLHRRLSRDRGRPLLQKGGRKDTLRRLWAERSGLYEEVCDYRFLSGGGAKPLADKIEATLRHDKVIRE